MNQQSQAQVITTAQKMQNSGVVQSNHNMNIQQPQGKQIQNMQ